jgi:CBS domain-containing protein
MRMREIIQTKGGHVFSITPDRTVHDAMRAMVDRQIGCLVVLERDAIQGIITERDILTFATRRTAEIDATTVGEIMTVDVITGAVEDRVQDVMNLMTERKVRHLPVLESGRLAGLVSIGDLVNAVRHDVESENRYMHDYIAGVVA